MSYFFFWCGHSRHGNEWVLLCNFLVVALPYSHYVMRSFPLCGVLSSPPHTIWSNSTIIMVTAKNKKQRIKRYPGLSTSRSDWHVLQRRCQPCRTPIYIQSRLYIYYIMLYRVPTEANYRMYARYRRHRSVRDGNGLPRRRRKLGLPERRYGKRFPFACRGTGMGRKGEKPFGIRDRTGIHDFLAGRDRTGVGPEKNGRVGNGSGRELESRVNFVPDRDFPTPSRPRYLFPPSVYRPDLRHLVSVPTVSRPAVMCIPDFSRPAVRPVSCSHPLPTFAHYFSHPAAHLIN